MDLKKSKKKLKKRSQTASAGFYVYRSEDKNAPFEEWERVTDKPVNRDFTDEEAKRGAKFYYYKLAEVYPEGGEGAPFDQNTYVRNGKRIERTPETAVMAAISTGQPTPTCRRTNGQRRTSLLQMIPPRFKAR